MARMRVVGIGLGTAATAVIAAAAMAHRQPMGVAEGLGFATGVLSVWMMVEENVWNWPVNIANNVLYAAVFARAGLPADTAIQVVCAGLGLLGWHRWRTGRGDGLPITRLGARSAAALGALAAGGTAAAAALLAGLGDAAPLPDALAAVLTLLAQYLVTRKRIETWPISIAAAGLYAAIYAWRGLDLTAALDLIFVAMSAAGLWRWRKLLAPRPWPSPARRKSSPAAVPPAPPTLPAWPRHWSSSPAPACSSSRS